MNKKSIVLVSVIAISIVSIGVYIFTQKPQTPNAMMDKKEVMMEKENKEEVVMEKNNEKEMKDNSKQTKLLPYSKNSFMSMVTTKRVLFFYANWCPTCKAAEMNFEKDAAKIPEDVTVLRVNYNDPDTDDEEKELAKKYGITYQHTFVQIGENGEELAKWNGGDVEELLSNIK